VEAACGHAAPGPEEACTLLPIDARPVVCFAAHCSEARDQMLWLPDIRDAFEIAVTDVCFLSVSTSPG
jgi:hypothetical protein